MEKLKLIIGPAPSELSYVELIGRLERERARISNALIKLPATRKSAKKKTAKKRVSRKKTLSLKQAQEILEKLISMEEPNAN